MSEYISLKMGVKFAESLNTGKNLRYILNIITYKMVRMSYNLHKLYQMNKR